MKYFIGIVLFLSVLNAQSQEVLNQYKYVVVASQYEFQSEQNQYDFNDLTIFLLKKSGLNILKTGGVFPADYNIGTCNALNVNIQVTGFLSQNMTVDFVDCTGTVVYSLESKSREKDYRKAYHECIREALESLDGYTYKFNPVNSMNNSVKESFQEIEEVIMEPEPFEESVDDIAATAIPVTTLKEFTYMDKPLKWRLKPEQNGGFKLYEYATEIGTLRKLSNNSFIVTATKFNGIAYPDGATIVLEYELDGALKKVVFFKNDL